MKAAAISAQKPESGSVRVAATTAAVTVGAHDITVAVAVLGMKKPTHKNVTRTT